MPRAVVTGGAGFLGSHLCEALCERGWEVVAVDSLLTGRRDNLERLDERDEFSFVEHDVTQYVYVAGGVDAVLHFASPASPKDYLEYPIKTLKVGSLGTHNTLGLAKAKGARYLLASTSEIYGDPEVHPQPESYWGNVNPVGPRGVYDEAKRFGEAMAMAYHHTHDMDVKVARIFNSILADEQVLYDDGTTLRRQAIGDLARGIEHGGPRPVGAPSFDAQGHIACRRIDALVGHPPTGPCYEVTTRYGRTVRVTGDHSLFVEGKEGLPEARTVTQLRKGDRVAIAGRIDVPERDVTSVRMSEAWDQAGLDPWRLNVVAPELGEIAWARRQELFRAWERFQPTKARSARNTYWGQVRGCRDRSSIPLGAMRALGIPIPEDARVRARGGGNATELPERFEISDELLWILGLFVAEGCWHRSEHDAFINISGTAEILKRVEKIIERDFLLHVTWNRGSTERAWGIFIHSRPLVALLDVLGFITDDKRIPGWILGLPLSRLKWFIEGYREGDGVHSGKKFVEGVRHEFSTTSTALKDDLVVAFARFGLVPSVGRYESTLKHRTGDRRYPFWRLTLVHVSPWSPLDWDRGVVQNLQSRRRGDIVWASVRSIEEIEPTDLVYDFCVPGTENFWAGSGVLAHNTYGPLLRPGDGRVISNFLVQALDGKPLTVYGDGNQSRSFCYVDDEVRGLLALLESDWIGPMNIGNPDEFTVLELAELVRELSGTGCEIMFEPLPIDDPARRRPDISLARDVLGWRPEVELREGLARTYEWYRRERDRGRA